MSGKLADRYLEKSHERNRAALARKLTRVTMLRRIRPTSLSTVFLNTLSERRIVDAEGIRVFIDPSTHLGHTILKSGSYEPETIRLFRKKLNPGDVFLDIGANEGFFTALGASLVGAQGKVIAIEPQSRLLDVLEINVALNAHCPVSIIQRAVGDEDGLPLEITLFPISNTGASSLVRKYRFGASTEQVETITVASIFVEAGTERVDFVKIDVEGYEPEVVRSMTQLLAERRIGALLVDYHRAILDSRGINPLDTHRLILSHGYTVEEGQPETGYVLYVTA